MYHKLEDFLPCPDPRSTIVRSRATFYLVGYFGSSFQNLDILALYCRLSLFLTAPVFPSTNTYFYSALFESNENVSSSSHLCEVGRCMAPLQVRKKS